MLKHTSKDNFMKEEFTSVKVKSHSPQSAKAQLQCSLDRVMSASGGFLVEVECSGDVTLQEGGNTGCRASGYTVQWRAYRRAKTYITNLKTTVLQVTTAVTHLLLNNMSVSDSSSETLSHPIKKRFK
jgi:hypothetical protein